MKKLLIIIILLLVLSSSSAFGEEKENKDYRFMPSIDGGPIWFLMYDNNAKFIEVSPNWAYGISLVQIVDFPKARGVAFEISYHRSTSRGEWQPMNDKEFQFDLTMDYATFNVGYFFTGRRIHPYISAGAGAAVFTYRLRDGYELIEADFALNGGGGADFTVWEPPGNAVEQMNLGARIRYIYIFPYELVDVSISAITIMLRFQLRF